MTSSSSRAIVTGGCGFVGSALTEALVRAGHDVTVVDDLSLGHPSNLGEVEGDVNLVDLDVRDGAGLESLFNATRPATIFHLAAIHFIPACDADPARAVSVNVVGSQALLSAAAAAGHEGSVVLTSTGAVYAPSLSAHKESDATVPSDIYGLTKLWMEQAAELHHRRTSMPIGIARLFNVVGPGETNPHLVPEIFDQARDSSVLHLGNLTTKRDYIHVGDVARGVMAMGAAAPQLGHVVCNIGAENAVDGFHVVDTVGEVLGRDLHVDTDPARLRKSDRPILESDCTRAHELLGWAVTTTLRESLEAAAGRPFAGVDPALKR